MTTVRTWKELEMALIKAKDEALKDASSKAVEVVQNRVDKDVYEAGNPTIYERTYQLRDRLDVLEYENKGYTSQATIGHDLSKMTYVSNLGQHASLIDGSSSLHSIAEIVHDGKSGHILGTGFWTKKRPYMSNAEEELRKGKYRQFIIDSLTKQGFDAR